MLRRIDRAFVKLMASATATSSIGMMPINLLPLLVGGWIEKLGASPSEAGAIGAAELGAMAIAAMMLSTRMHVLSRRRLAVLAGLGVLLANLASAYGTNLDLLLAVRLVAGLCEGALLAAFSATIAGARDPERLFAGVGITSGLIAVAMLVLVPVAIAHWGTTGAFLAMSALTLMSLPLLTRLPSFGRTRAVGAPPGARMRAPGGGEPLARGSIRRAGVVLAFAAVLVATGQAAVWSFSERIGEGLGYDATTIGLILGAASLSGTLGALAAAFLGADRGRALPLLAGYVGVIVAIGLVTGGARAEAFAAGQVVFAFFYFFVSPYVMGVAAALDPHGRVASALSGGLLVGAGLGPAAGGVLVERFDFVTLGVAGTLLVGLSGLLLLVDAQLRVAVVGSRDLPVFSRSRDWPDPTRRG
jgi:predicted MFS family arabinose efflux permease